MIKKKKDGKWINFSYKKTSPECWQIKFKQGICKDLFLNYWKEYIILFKLVSSAAQILKRENILEIVNFRNSRWIYICKNLRIVGEFFNTVSQNQGQWIELNKGYYSHMNDTKVGIWDIIYCKNNEKEYKLLLKLYSGIFLQMQMVEGQYDQEGNQKKDRKRGRVGLEFSL